MKLMRILKRDTLMMNLSKCRVRLIVRLARKALSVKLLISTWEFAGIGTVNNYTYYYRPIIFWKKGIIIKL